MSKSTKETSAYYKDAIRKLRLYLAVETNDDMCKEATAKISEYRIKIADVVFDEITYRTKHLTTLMYDLQAIIANASKEDGLSDVIGGFRNIVDEVSIIVNPSVDNVD